MKRKYIVYGLSLGALLLLLGNLGILQKLSVTSEVTDLRDSARPLIGELQRIGIRRVKDTRFERLDQHAIPVRTRGRECRSQRLV